MEQGSVCSPLGMAGLCLRGAMGAALRSCYRDADGKSSGYGRQRLFFFFQPEGK